LVLIVETRVLVHSSFFVLKLMLPERKLHFCRTWALHVQGLEGLVYGIWLISTSLDFMWRAGASGARHSPYQPQYTLGCTGWLAVRGRSGHPALWRLRFG